MELTLLGTGTPIPSPQRAGPSQIVQVGWTMEHDHGRAQAIKVDHYPVEDAFAFRFDADDASLVISGDTAPYEPLAKAAAGVDVLVHEAWLKPKDEPARQRMSPEQAE